jgi:hypothetical protein
MNSSSEKVPSAYRSHLQQVSARPRPHQQSVIDLRPEATNQRKLQAMADSSPRATQLRAAQLMMEGEADNAGVEELEEEVDSLSEAGMPETGLTAEESEPQDAVADTPVIVAPTRTSKKKSRRATEKRKAKTNAKKTKAKSDKSIGPSEFAPAAASAVSDVVKPDPTEEKKEEANPFEDAAQKEAKRLEEIEFYGILQTIRKIGIYRYFILGGEEYHITLAGVDYHVTTSAAKAEQERYFFKLDAGVKGIFPTKKQRGPVGKYDSLKNASPKLQNFVHKHYKRLLPG